MQKRVATRGSLYVYTVTDLTRPQSRFLFVFHFPTLIVFSTIKSERLPAKATDIIHDQTPQLHASFDTSCLLHTKEELGNRYYS